MVEFDYLIIGQGLAGSLLAWRLLNAGKRVMLLDNGHKDSSSLVAAGLINPLAGMRFNRPPRINDWLQAANHTYAALENQSGQSLLHAVDMVRLFRSAKQQRFWQRQSEQPGAQAYLGDRFSPGASGQPVNSPHGGFHQHRTGYVELPLLLGLMSGSLRDRDSLVEAELDYRDIRLGATQHGWQQLNAREIIFCEGYRARQNPWFDWLPFDAAKGEILTLQGTGTLPDRIINGAHWLVPLAQGGFRFGATYDHQQLDNRPTRAARDELLNGLGQLLSDASGLEIAGHQAGVRPVTRDKQPFLGSHPAVPRLHVFNGFGAKGTLTIPWYAERFTDYLLNGAGLPAEADIARFEKNV